MKRSLTIVTLTVALSGCSFYARGPEDYSKVTKHLVKTRQDQLKGCYRDVIADDPEAAGDVAVAFQMEAKTGKLHSPAVVPEKTTAPEALSQCVMTALDGLVLDAPDQRTGQAEFVWSFERS